MSWDGATEYRPYGCRNWCGAGRARHSRRGTGITSALALSLLPSRARGHDGRRVHPDFGRWLAAAPPATFLNGGFPLNRQ